MRNIGACIICAQFFYIAIGTLEKSCVCKLEGIRRPLKTFFKQPEPPGCELAGCIVIEKEFDDDQLRPSGAFPSKWKKIKSDLRHS
jgi:hypothetical protein